MSIIIDKPDIIKGLGSKNFDIWLDKKNSLIVKVTYQRMGSWEYRLKNYE